MTFLAATALSILAATAQVDTVVPVQPGARLNVFNLGGDVRVEAWDENSVRIQAATARPMLLDVRRKGPVLLVTSHGARVPHGFVSYRFSVPRWIHVDINGINNDVSVSGVDGEVVVETVRGGVNVKGGRGLVQLRSLEGVVKVEGARGRVQASSVNRGVWVLDTQGEVVANSVNGNVILGKVVADLVEVNSANGDLIWDGEFSKTGRYAFGTHNGNIVVVTKGEPDARVSVQTFTGDFESSFPIEVRDDGGRGMYFTFGDGRAALEFESFQGRIQFVQEGSEQGRRAMEYRRRALRDMQRQIEQARVEVSRELMRLRQERDRRDRNDR